MRKQRLLFITMLSLAGLSMACADTTDDGARSTDQQLASGKKADGGVKSRTLADGAVVVSNDVDTDTDGVDDYDSNDKDGDTDSDSDSDCDGDTDSDSDTDSDGLDNDLDTDSDSDSDSDGTCGAPAVPPVVPPTPVDAGVGI